MYITHTSSKWRWHMSVLSSICCSTTVSSLFHEDLYYYCVNLWQSNIWRLNIPFKIQFLSENGNIICTAITFRWNERNRVTIKGSDWQTKITAEKSKEAIHHIKRIADKLELLSTTPQNDEMTTSGMKSAIKSKDRTISFLRKDAVQLRKRIY